MLVVLQARLWFSDGGVLAERALAKRVEEEHARSAALATRNAHLATEVRDLKSGHAAVEARARSELGMVKQGETFYLVAPR